MQDLASTDYSSEDQDKFKFSQVEPATAPPAGAEPTKNPTKYKMVRKLGCAPTSNQK